MASRREQERENGRLAAKPGRDFLRPLVMSLELGAAGEAVSGSVAVRSGGAVVLVDEAAEEIAAVDGADAAGYGSVPRWRQVEAAMEPLLLG
jgi:hypothetical protein